MFGIGKDERVAKQIAGVINGAVIAFDKAIAVTAALSGQAAPPFGDKYLAILLGFADAICQAANVGMDTTKKALQIYLSTYPDSHEVFAHMMTLSNDRGYFEWQVLGGRAIQQSRGDGDKVTSMMQLAKAYFS